MATQMAEARFDQVGVDIQAVDGDARYGLRATGQTMVFDGFIRVYTEGRDEGPTKTPSRACRSSRPSSS